MTVTPTRLALAGAEAARKCDVALEPVLGYCLLKQLYELLSASKMAGGADTDLYNHYSSYIPFMSLAEMR